MTDGTYRALDRIRTAGARHPPRASAGVVAVALDAWHAAVRAAGRTVDPKAEVRTVKSVSEKLYQVTEVTRDADSWYVRLVPAVETDGRNMWGPPDDDMTQCCDQP